MISNTVPHRIHRIVRNLFQLLSTVGSNPPAVRSRSLSDPAGFDGSTSFAGRVGSPQSMYITDSIIEEKVRQGI